MSQPPALELLVGRAAVAREVGTPIALGLEEFEVMDLTFGHARAGLEIRDAKAIVLLSQGIPESAGHVHKTFGIEVGRTIYY
jgi:hypothetical protein